MRRAVVLLLFLGKSVYGQKDTTAKSSLFVQVEWENGGMISNNQDVRRDFADVYYSGVNLRVGWQTKPGGDPYNKLYNYPVYGLGLYSSTFRKPEIGTPYALYGFFMSPIKPKELSRWAFSYRIGLGLAFNFQPYDAVDNPLNTMLGTSRNVYIDLGLQAAYRIGKNFEVGAGLSFHHFSNGAYRLPNKGINLLPLGLTVTYKPSNTPVMKGDSLTKPKIKRDMLHISVAGGLKQVDKESPKQYSKNTISVYWSRAAGYKWRLGFGGDLFYSDSGSAEEVAGEKSGKLASLFSGGPAFYVDHILLRRLYVNGSIGYYLHRNSFNGEINPVFLRIGVRSKIYKELFTGVSIKAHMGKADYVEWSLGYALGK